MDNCQQFNISEVQNKHHILVKLHLTSSELKHWKSHNIPVKVLEMFFW